MNSKQEERVYFQSNQKNIRINLDTYPSQRNRKKLRDVQAGAYWAVLGHFTSSNTPAIVSMPTGTGKTAVMTMIAFGLVKRRLLIIAPSRIILDQIENEFNTLNVLKETGCVFDSTDEFKPPKIKVVDKSLRNKKDWEKLSNYDVILSTIQCSAPWYKKVCKPPDRNLYDTIFFDEAHHLGAPTWNNLMNYFPKAKYVGFTATPYRRDKKIPGEVVYNYPLKKACDNGYLSKVKFIAVEAPDKQKRDLFLAQKAVEIWKKFGKKAKLLVRIARIAKTEEIQDLYKSLNLNLEIVDSSRSLTKNLENINKVQTHQNLHGIIAIGMLGEGLDMPNLRIGVLHTPFQSLSITIQFIGRISRFSAVFKKESVLLAIPDDVYDLTQRLDNIDDHWMHLIQDLADFTVDKVVSRQRLAKNLFYGSELYGGISSKNLRPSCSATVYKIEGGEVNLQDTISNDFNIRTNKFQDYISKDDRTRIIITITETKPLWLTENIVNNRSFDLHIFHHNQNLIFMSSTFPKIAKKILSQLTRSVEILELVDDNTIKQIISHGIQQEYYAVGMRKVVNSGPRIPTYKMVLGNNTESAIRHADGNFFSLGHLFGSLYRNNKKFVYGISPTKGKIWSPYRHFLEEFREWCDTIFEIIIGTNDDEIPFLSDLKERKKVENIPSQPIGVMFSKEFFNHVENELVLDAIDGQGRSTIVGEYGEIDISIMSESWDPASDQSHLCDFELIAENATCKIKVIVHYDHKKVLKQAFSYEIDPPFSKCNMTFKKKGRSFSYEIGNYISDFPPTIFLYDGGSIDEGLYVEYKERTIGIPNGIFTTKDWEGPQLNCNIRIEDAKKIQDPKSRENFALSGKKSVLDATSVMLNEKFNSSSFIFSDHRKGEIADYIVLESHENNSLNIHFFHCKAMNQGAPNPGVRQSDVIEVIAQGRKSTRWIGRKDLFYIMKQRIEESRKDNFNTFTQNVPLPNVHYSIHLVQPGLRISSLKTWRDPSIRRLILSLYEELQNLDIDLYIIGS